jgi:hypothetical protein
LQQQIVLFVYTKQSSLLFFLQQLKSIPGFTNPDKKGILSSNDLAIIKLDEELPDVNLIPILPKRFYLANVLFPIKTT